MGTAEGNIENMISESVFKVEFGDQEEVKL